MNTAVNANETVRTAAVLIRDMVEIAAKGKSLSATLVKEFNTSDALANELVGIAINTGFIDEQGTLTEEGLEYYDLINGPAAKLGVLRVVRGLPGAGKSRLAWYIAQGLASEEEVSEVTLLEPDMFMTDEEGNYKFELNRVKECALHCIAATEIALLSGHEVVVNSIFSKIWEIAPYFQMAGRCGAQVQLIEAQGHWRSASRSANLKKTLRENWTRIFLPFNLAQWQQRKVEESVAAPSND